MLCTMNSSVLDRHCLLWLWLRWLLLCNDRVCNQFQGKRVWRLRPASPAGPTNSHNYAQHWKGTNVSEERSSNCWQSGGIWSELPPHFSFRRHSWHKVPSPLNGSHFKANDFSCFSIRQSSCTESFFQKFAIRKYSDRSRLSTFTDTKTILNFGSPSSILIHFVQKEASRCSKLKFSNFFYQTKQFVDRYWIQRYLQICLQPTGWQDNSLTDWARGGPRFPSVAPLYIDKVTLRNFCIDREIMKLF